MKPCPCGAQDGYQCLDQHVKGGWKGHCIHCGRSGPYKVTQDEAITAWNQMVKDALVWAAGRKWLAAVKTRKAAGAKITFRGRVVKGSPEDKILDEFSKAGDAADAARRELLRILEEE